jgi:hypothetical protein
MSKHHCNHNGARHNGKKAHHCKDKAKVKQGRKARWEERHHGGTTNGLKPGTRTKDGVVQGKLCIPKGGW